MAKEYWACYHAGELKLAPGKHTHGALALAAAYGEDVVADDSTKARPLGTRKAEAEDAFWDLMTNHKQARARDRAAHQDVEAEALSRTRQVVQDYEEALATFTAKLTEQGPVEALRWRGDDIIEAEFRATCAHHVLRMVQKQAMNPVKALRLVRAEVERRLIDDSYTKTASGIFSRPVGDAVRAAASRYIRHFSGGLYPIFQAEHRDEARAELGLEPIDYEAPYEAAQDTQAGEQPDHSKEA